MRGRVLLWGQNWLRARKQRVGGQRAIFRVESGEARRSAAGTCPGAGALQDSAWRYAAVRGTQVATTVLPPKYLQSARQPTGTSVRSLVWTEGSRPLSMQEDASTIEAQHAYKPREASPTLLPASAGPPSAILVAPTQSSDDEVEVLLHGTPEQKRKLIRECLTGESESSSEDEFQKEMEAELDCTMKDMEGKWKSQLEGGGTSGAGQSGTATTSKYYDDIYFDSDSEDEDKVVAPETKKKRKHQQRRIPTNDELFYDPEEDNRDQAWIDKKRREYHNLRSVRSQQQVKLPAIPSSDAVLNCPACMTTLCFDCQRHESYRTQYRAMFVMNCTVIKEEILKYKGPLNKMAKRRHKKIKQSSESVAGPEKQEEEEIYHPVRCTECSTEVAVLDKDEVFHFFNVLASHA